MATKENENIEPIIPQPEKWITIKLPIDFNGSDEDKVVWVNDKRYIIQRGIPVDVPESVADILRQEEENEAIAYGYEKKLASKRKN